MEQNTITGRKESNSDKVGVQNKGRMNSCKRLSDKGGESI